jgi:hypothetical protein
MGRVHRVPGGTAEAVWAKAHESSIRRTQSGRKHFGVPRPAPLKALMTRFVTSETWSPFEAAFRQAASVERLRRYRLRSDKGAWLPAIARYQYNIELGRALYPVLHTAEVALRNHLFDVIQAVNPHAISAGTHSDRMPCLGCWLDDETMSPGLREDERRKVVAARDELRFDHVRRHRATPEATLTVGHLVAALRFGFWTKLLDGVYANWREATSNIWTNDLHELAFPYSPALPGRRRGDAHTRFTEIKEIRNRVFHHEHLRQFTMAQYDRIVEGLSWISPTLGTTLDVMDRPRVKQLVDDGYAPHRDAIDALLSAHFRSSVPGAAPPSSPSASRGHG